MSVQAFHPHPCFCGGVTSASWVPTGRVFLSLIIEVMFNAGPYSVGVFLRCTRGRRCWWSCCCCCSASAANWPTSSATRTHTQGRLGWVTRADRQTGAPAVGCGQWWISIRQDLRLRRQCKVTASRRHQATSPWRHDDVTKLHQAALKRHIGKFVRIGRISFGLTLAQPGHPCVRMRVSG